MSIKGVARFYKGRKKHIITTQTEHKCVLDSCRAMEQEGYEASKSLMELPDSVVVVAVATGADGVGQQTEKNTKQFCPSLPSLSFR